MIYGTRAVIEAIESGKEIDKLFIQKGLKNELTQELRTLAAHHSVPISNVPVEKLNRFTRKNHQGTVAFLSEVSFASLDNVINSAFTAGRDPFLIILDGVTDVRNFGAIARTAECAGADGIIVPSKGSAAINSDAIKTSAGALHHIPVIRTMNLTATLKDIRNSGLRLVGVTEKAEGDMYQAELFGPLALLMGSEEKGIEPRHLDLCDQIIKIPMFGKIASLNVSVSSAVALYEVVRQRKAL